MSKTREILRLRWNQGLSVRDTARATNASTGVVSTTEKRARRAGLDWAALDDLDDAALDARLYGGPKGHRGDDRPRPDPVWIATELRKKGVTLELLHLEYLDEHPKGLRYTAFCDTYRAWKKKSRVTMRQEHKAGERAFVDYSGKKPTLVDAVTGDVREVEFFVGVLGASNLTFAEATESQRLSDFIGSHVRMLEYFGGVPAILVPDQLRSAVRRPDRYEATVNRTYAELGRHYGTAIVPARPRKPKDKAKVERAVQIAQRWILARLRHETFFSLDALNQRIRELVDDLNLRPMKSFGNKTRRELFEVLDQPVLRSLPAHRFEPSEWKWVRVAPDYHVQVDHNFYSVPYTLHREEVELRLTATTIEVWYLNHRVTSHVRRQETMYKHYTNPEHMPDSHREVFEGGRRVRAWAETIGPATRELVEQIFSAQPFEMQGWRSCQGLRRLESKYGPERLELASAKTLSLNGRSYKSVERLLRLGRERDDETQDNSQQVDHDNVRGANYYH